MAHKSKVPTLHDVAQLAGVSISTASRVLSDSDNTVNEAMRRKVIKAATELKYVPNAFGQRLKHNASDTIGVIVPSLQNPFYNQVIIGIESAAAKLGCEIRLFSSHRSAAQERRAINLMLHNRVMALIIISVDTSPDALTNFIAFGGKVALLEADFHLDHAIVFETDYLDAGATAARHLVKLGHRKIAFLTAPLTKISRRDTLTGIESVLKDAGLKFSSDDVFIAPTEGESSTGVYEFEVGRQLAERMLRTKKPYTAVIAVNDIMAFGAIQTITQRGYSVPNDISVMGFDNIMYSEMISPPLTTIEMPSVNMGRTACQLLFSSMDIDGEDAANASLRFPLTLRQRRSTAPRQR
ncbi:MAG: LacI family DNA-binding transcriptional regulator [Oscillospiraceae bacterium]|nr:LacI family DNA-binding transcriptional regulator [Oscillospiraceae bacterium]